MLSSGHTHMHTQTADRLLYTATRMVGSDSLDHTACQLRSMQIYISLLLPF